MILAALFHVVDKVIHCPVQSGHLLFTLSPLICDSLEEIVTDLLELCASEDILDDVSLSLLALQLKALHRLLNACPDRGHHLLIRHSCSWLLIICHWHHRLVHFVTSGSLPFATVRLAILSGSLKHTVGAILRKTVVGWLLHSWCWLMNLLGLP